MGECESHVMRHVELRTSAYLALQRTRISGREVRREGRTTREGWQALRQIREYSTHTPVLSRPPTHPPNAVIHLSPADPLGYPTLMNRFPAASMAAQRSHTQISCPPTMLWRSDLHHAGEARGLIHYTTTAIIQHGERKGGGRKIIMGAPVKASFQPRCISPCCALALSLTQDAHADKPEDVEGMDKGIFAFHDCLGVAFSQPAFGILSDGGNDDRRLTAANRCPLLSSFFYG